MTHTWILDVLADLQTFAQENDLPELAAKLNDTAHTATREISTNSASTSRAVSGWTNGSMVGAISGNLGSGR